MTEDLISLEEIGHQIGLGIATMRGRFNQSNIPCVLDNKAGNKIYIDKRYVSLLTNFSMPRHIWRGGRGKRSKKVKD